MGRTASVLTDDMEHCFFCGRPYPQVHHVFSGTSNRKISDKYGYVVPLCMEHHTGQNGVHQVREMNLFFKVLAQQHFEKHHGTREDFIKQFGKSWL